MKNIAIKLFCAAILVFGSVKADIYTTNNLPASTNNVTVSGPVILSKLILSTTNSTPTIVKLYDGGPTTVTPLWTNYTTFTTNLVSSVITSTGTTNTYTNKVIYTVAKVNAAATNATVAKLVFEVDSLNPVQWPLNIGFPSSDPYAGASVQFNSKITLDTSAAGVNAVIQYRSP